MKERNRTRKRRISELGLNGDEQAEKQFTDASHHYWAVLEMQKKLDMEEARLQQQREAEEAEAARLQQLREAEAVQLQQMRRELALLQQRNPNPHVPPRN